jgi:DNA-binding MarR family transcriptional regulator
MELSTVGLTKYAGRVPVDDVASESLIYALSELTFELANETNAVVGEVLAQLDLTAPLANALWHLDPSAPALPMRDLASRLNCDPSTVTFLADRLEERGLLQRRVDPKNRRVKLLVLTTKGQRARGALVERMATGSPIARLPVRDQQQLHRLLTKALGRQLENRPHVVDEACQAAVDGASLGHVQKRAVRRSRDG